MSKPNWLISVASWEERFRLGTLRILETEEIAHVSLFYYKENEALTEANRKAVVDAFKEKGLNCEPIPISFEDPAASWHLLAAEAYAPATDRHPLLDITTMPRDTIWGLLALLGINETPIPYAYHCPEDYGNWQSRDPGKPRLVYKLSGIATLGRSTCLIVATGFDPERTRQLMWHYEPSRVLLVFQTGEQYDNANKNIEKHQRALKDEYQEFDVTEHELDAYADDRGQSALMKLASEQMKECNVIMTSLGPKLGAIAMYEVHKALSETGLVYTPSGEFNPDYSKGLSKTITGVVRP